MLPFKDLVDSNQNVYEMTCVAIKESEIYASTDVGKNIEKKGERIIPVVLNRALNNEIEYREADGH